MIITRGRGEGEKQRQKIADFGSVREIYVRGGGSGARDENDKIIKNDAKRERETTRCQGSNNSWIL
jgi:hypothetical protein